MQMNRWLLGGLVVIGPLAVIGLVGGCPANSIGGSGSGSALGFNLPPTVVVSADVTRGVAPLTVRFDSSASSDDGVIVSRLWDFGDGSTSQNIAPTHDFTGTGQFAVKLTITDDVGAQASRTINISVTESPVAVISTDRTVAEAAPAVINFNASSSFDPDGSIDSFQWDFGDGTRELLEQVAHVYSASGTYTVRLTVTDNVGVTNSTTAIIQVGIPTPAIGFRAPGPDRKNIVVSDDSPLWVQAIYSVQDGVPRFTTAGLDGDLDACEAQTVIFDAQNATKLRTLLGHFDKINSAGYSHDGTLVISGGDDAFVRVFDTTNGAQIASFATETKVTSVAFSPDGRSFVYGMTNGKVIWQDRLTSEVYRTFTQHVGQVRSVAFGPDGTTALSGANDRHAILWDLIDGNVLRDYVHDTGVASVAFNPLDKTQVATGSEDSKIRIWSITSGSLLNTLSGHSASVTALVYAADGSALISGSEDHSAKQWNPQVGAEVLTYAGAGETVLAVDISKDGAHVIAGSADGSARMYKTSTGTLEQTFKPCVSPISAAKFAPSGLQVLTAVAARNDIQLDTDPPNGNDLNVTIPQSLALKNVPSLAGLNVAAGTYTLWTQIDTDRTSPVRSYALPVINVVGPFTATITAETPVVPLVSDEADIIFAPSLSRQICDLGSLLRDDRVFISFFETPGYSETFTLNSGYSVALLDGDSKIFAWFESGFIPISAESKLVIGHGSAHNYLVVDGGVGVHVRIQRESLSFAPKLQRVLVDFNAAAAVKVDGQPAVDIAALSAPTFNQFWAVSPGYTEADTPQLQQSILSTMRSQYAGYNIEFIGSNEVAAGATLTPPYQTMHIGSSYSPYHNLFGVADYLDPRNDITSGSAIIFGLEFDVTIDLNGQFFGFQFPVQNLADLGYVIGQVAAHECGHLLGLRHTDDPTDTMSGGGDDITMPHSMKASPVSVFEQVYGQPSIGIQDTPLYLSEVLGAAP